MRQLVNTKTFRLKKKLDNILHAILPSNWIPLYSMVGIYSVGVQNLLSSDLFAHIFKRDNQQFKICMYVNFVLSFYRHQMLKESTLLY